MAQQPHQAGGHYDDGYGQQGDGYYHDDQIQAYYDNNNNAANHNNTANQHGEGYYDER